MKSISKILMAISVLLSTLACEAQIKNTTTETVKIYGNCEMCETNIEKAGSMKKIVKVDWDKNTKMATLTYDAEKTNQDEILKRIALAGYDSDKFLAPDKVYAKLEACCQYERVNKKTTLQAEVKENHSTHTKQNKETSIEANLLQAIFDSYFAIKDALVKTDGSTASIKAKELVSLINAIKMEKLSKGEHTVLMKVMKDLAFDAEHIEETKNVEHQREHFSTLSKNIYALVKVSKQGTPTYFQHCPMYNDGKGADWLSKENIIKNPYYGSQMLSCGKTVETIK